MSCAPLSAEFKEFQEAGGNFNEDGKVGLDSGGWLVVRGVEFENMICALDLRWVQWITIFVYYGNFMIF